MNIKKRFPVKLTFVYSDTRTRYESSVLLWEQFLLSTSETSAWIYETQEKIAVIRSSTLHTDSLLEEMKVSNHSLADDVKSIGTVVLANFNHRHIKLFILSVFFFFPI